MASAWQEILSTLLGSGTVKLRLKLWADLWKLNGLAWGYKHVKLLKPTRSEAVSRVLIVSNRSWPNFKLNLGFQKCLLSFKEVLAMLMLNGSFFKSVRF